MDSINITWNICLICIFTVTAIKMEADMCKYIDIDKLLFVPTFVRKSCYFYGRYSYLMIHMVGTNNHLFVRSFTISDKKISGPTSLIVNFYCGYYDSSFFPLDLVGNSLCCCSFFYNFLQRDWLVSLILQCFM